MGQRHAGGCAVRLSFCEMRVAALIFDLDGTLSDPVVVGIGRSLNFALEAFG